MKDMSYSFMLGISIGTCMSWFVRGALYWDVWTWLVILGFTLYVYAIWKFDNRNSYDV